MNLILTLMNPYFNPNLNEPLAPNLIQINPVYIPDSNEPWR